MSKYTFPERNNTVNKNGVSLIVVTSPIPSHPDTTLIDTAIESTLKMNYPFSEMIISYDKDRKNTSSYKTYKKRMKSKYPQFKHLELDKHGHFIGTFHNALNHCKTKYFFLLQHDISLIGKFPIQECLDSELSWNIIATHHFKPEECDKDIPKPTHWFPIMKKTQDKNLLKTYGWSERIFLSKRDWMMDKIHEYYHKGKTVNFIESIFHKEFDKLWKREQKIKTFHKISTEPQYMKIYDKFWSEWKVYNLKSSVAYHKHLHGRTAKRSNKRNNKKITKRKTKRKHTKAGLMVKIDGFKPKTRRRCCRACREPEPEPEQDYLMTWETPHKSEEDCAICALNFIGLDLESSEIQKGLDFEKINKLLEKKYPELDFSMIDTGVLDINPEVYEDILNDLFSNIENNYVVLTRLSFKGKSIGHMVIMGKKYDIPFFFDAQKDEFIYTISNISKKLVEMEVTRIRIIIGKDKITGEIYKDDDSLGL
tara:strand:+ start:63 stop:1502 length:1440 start_codon:yes stop_codon:yes gene_type:complete